MIMTINIKIIGGEEGVKENSDQTLEPESPRHLPPPHRYTQKLKK